MSREIRKIVHLFIPEDSGGIKPNSCEAHYFKLLFQRRLKNYQLKIYTHAQETKFKKALKFSAHPDDKFFIVTDLDFTEDRSNLRYVKKKIRNLAELGENAKLFVSGRSFEVWLCMYHGVYTKSFISQAALNKTVARDYTKKERWYVKERGRLYNNLRSASANAKKSRRIILSGSTRDKKRYVTELPDFNDEELLDYFITRETFTYVDLLVKELQRLSRG
ncbi:RloB domain-containing protein [Paenilisteria newyorkensis]|uniref:RloB domain-containing protein n=1 Tax=Listeria newyorkensis TaxID=1497681 RepID=UPI000669E2AF|nr:RloB domain-containing protein [Listeria newyorkensis]KMT61609.1 hypothetical protein X559_2048 [Listeria newyorkensis]